MSVKCKGCGTVWVLQQGKCPKCGLPANGKRPSQAFGLTEQTNPPAPPPAPPAPPADMLGRVDTTPSYDSGTGSCDAPASTDYSSGGGDFSGGGGGSDF